MPSHTIHSALVQMWYDGNGTPWNYPQWQAITSVRNGLFNANNSLLPAGWSRSMADFIRSYFDQYSKKPKEDEKIKFSAARSGALSVPGRDQWRGWVTTSWRHWGIHARITEVLSTENLHPFLLALNSSLASLDTLPNGAQICPLAVDPVARALFGDEAMNPLGMVHMELRGTTQALIQRTWLNLSNQFTRSKKRIVNLEKDAIEAFESLDRDKLTKAKIKTVIVKVARWKALANVLHTKENIEKMETMDAELRRLMAGLGGRVTVSSLKNGQDMTKVNTQMLKSLASEGDVADVLNLYDEFFQSLSPSDSVSLVDQQPSIDVSLEEPDGDVGLGIEYEISLPPEKLAEDLGFKDNLPLLFNKYRHCEGLSAWDPANTALFNPSNAMKNPEMVRLQLHWHQLCGIHAMVRMVFAEESVATFPGILIGDDVGLGKTFQLAGMIAFLTDLHMRQTLRESKPIPLPPIIERNPYLGTHTTLPDLPHLILVPGTLLSQWETELQVVFRPKMFDILMYGTGKSRHEKFWAPDGPFYTSKHKANHRIILASHSALQQDFSQLYCWTKPVTGSLPWAHPPRMAGFASSVQATLFRQKYLSTTIDEAQGFRNVGSKHSSGLLILEQSVLRFIMTATPLQTSTKDLAAMGRLIGIPHFFSDDALAEEKADISNIRRAKLNSLDEERETAAVKECQASSARRIQGQFEGRILRRTGASLGWDKKPLIVLPPLEEFLVLVKPTPRELEIIGEHADRSKRSASISNSMLMIASKDFYIEHRKCVGYARHDLTEDPPTFSSLQEWEEKKSTKIDTCAKMCQHLLQRDDAPAMIFQDGTVIFPPIPPPTPGEKVLQQKKIIIYQEFPTLGPLLRNILELYGIRCAYIDGQTTFQNRAKITRAFRTDLSLRVLIISSVGSTGLNLTVASTVIFVDQPWSAQDERQIRGRAHRQHQTMSVACFHILADETADVVLASLARGKKDMLETFLKKAEGADLVDLLSGKIVASPEDDYEEDDPEYQELKKEEKKRAKAEEKAEEKKRKAKKAKGKSKEGEMPSGDVNDHGEDQARPKKRRTKKKKADESDSRNGEGALAQTVDVPPVENHNMVIDIPVSRSGATTTDEDTTDHTTAGLGNISSEVNTDDFTDPDRSTTSDGATDPDMSMTSDGPDGPTGTPPPVQTAIRRRPMLPDSPEVAKEKKRRRMLPEQEERGFWHSEESDGGELSRNGPDDEFQLQRTEADDAENPPVAPAWPTRSSSTYARNFFQPSETQAGPVLHATHAPAPWSGMSKSGHSVLLPAPPLSRTPYLDLSTLTFPASSGSHATRPANTRPHIEPSPSTQLHHTPYATFSTAAQPVPSSSSLPWAPTAPSQQPPIPANLMTLVRPEPAFLPPGVPFRMDGGFASSRGSRLSGPGVSEGGRGPASSSLLPHAPQHTESNLPSSSFQSGIRQATVYGRRQVENGELSPPPVMTPSRNPYSRQTKNVVRNPFASGSSSKRRQSGT